MCRAMDGTEFGTWRHLNYSPLCPDGWMIGNQWEILRLAPRGPNTAHPLLAGLEESSAPTEASKY